MIQLKRGSTKSWRGSKTKLEPGQPGYDKDKHKIKVGDGEATWKDLPYATGLFAEEILDSELAAEARHKKDSEDTTLITYGTDAPDENTVGKLYLQQSTTDHIVEAGISKGWTYQIYNSGIMRCCGVFKVSLDITDSIEGTGLYCGNGTFKQDYPKTFKNQPSESVSVQSSSGLAWLANKSANTTTSSGTYTVISPASSNNVEYTISIQVEGLKK